MLQKVGEGDLNCDPPYKGNQIMKLSYKTLDSILRFNFDKIYISSSIV